MVAQTAKQGFDLIPEEIPAIRKSSIYETILDTFLDTGKSPVRVKVADRTSSTITQGLIKAKSKDSKYRTVDIVRRGDSVWLKSRSKGK